MSEIPLQPCRPSQTALGIYAEVLEAVRVEKMLERAVRFDGDIMNVEELEFDLSTFRRIIIVGAGKASAMMAAWMESKLESRGPCGIVVTKADHAVPTRYVTVLEAGHPVPDQRSLKAGKAIVELLSSAGPKDFVIVMISGGCSALMEYPVDGVSLSDISDTTNLLMRAGADIGDLNSVRSCLSQVKAGGLARAAGNSVMLCLVVSDVLGNPLSVIGSGPCLDVVPDPARAINVLTRFMVRDKVPKSVVSRLEHLAETTLENGPDHQSGRVSHVIIGDINSAVSSASSACERRELRTMVLTSNMEGEAREVGKRIGRMARAQYDNDLLSTYKCYILAGETTVTVTGSGLGGRSQELAAAAAIEIEGCSGISILAAGTDGTDGPTDAGGACVDGNTANLARTQGRNLEGALSNNDCYHALDIAGALIRTGPTHSNVGDIVIVVFDKGLTVDVE